MPIRAKDWVNLVTRHPAVNAPCDHDHVGALDVRDRGQANGGMRQ
jgi:hypothetical protein